MKCLNNRNVQYAVLAVVIGALAAFGHVEAAALGVRLGFAGAILDAHLQFSDEQAVTATAVATNVIDLSQDRAIGNGEPMGVMFTVDVAADQTTGDEDYTFDVEYASNAAQTTGRQLIGRRVFESGTPTAPAQNADLLVAGFQFVIPIPPTSQDESEQFLGVRYTVAGTTPSITVSAHLMPLSMIPKHALYADGFDIT